MGAAARALVCCNRPNTARSLARIVEASPTLTSMGVVDCRGEALALMAQRPDVVVVDATLDADRGVSFAERLAGSSPVLLVVDPGQEQAAASAVAGCRRVVQVIGRDVVERGETSSDSVVRTRLCLLAAQREGAAAFVPEADLERGAVLESLARQGHDAVVLVGSAGTPHLLPRLLPKTSVGGAPLVIAVHHNPRFSDDFIAWVGDLCGRRPRPFDADAVVSAGPHAVFVARAVESTTPHGALLPDLGGLLESLAERGLRLLVCVASGMDDPMAPRLDAVVHAGGTVVALDPDECSQPSMVLAALSAGVVGAEVSVEGIAWLIARACSAGAEKRP